VGRPERGGPLILVRPAGRTLKNRWPEGRRQRISVSTSPYIRCQKSRFWCCGAPSDDRFVLLAGIAFVSQAQATVLRVFVVKTDNVNAYVKEVAKGAGSQEAPAAPRHSTGVTGAIRRPRYRPAGIEPAIGMHTLRHTYASSLVQAGVSLAIVAEALGHADTRMVSKHYGHLAPSQVADAIRAHLPALGIDIDSTVTRIRP